MIEGDKIMQVFLPYSNIEESVKHLDNQRLNKQMVECHQILNAIVNKTGWKSHPISVMYSNNINSLVDYGLAACLEAKGRNIKWEKNYDKIISFYNDSLTDDPPEWLGRQDIHDSHKSRLLCKGEIDMLYLAIKKHFKFRSINTWLLANPIFKKEKNYLKFQDINRLRQIVKENQISLDGYKNYYKQYNWQVPMDSEYIWAKQ